MISLGTMLYLVARSLPRVDEEISGKKDFLDRLSSSEIPEKIDAAFNGFILKTLRKTKVVLMRIDNFINDKLKKISPSNKNKASVNEKIDFKELAEESADKKEIDPV